MNPSLEASAAGQPRDPETLRQAWTALKAQQPRLRIRDAADSLGASEAELLATGCSAGTDGSQDEAAFKGKVIRLRPEWDALVQELPSLGRVMALTRNDHAVHEKRGVYGNISIQGKMGLVLNHDIDLRLFLFSWSLGFAVLEALDDRVRRSLQIFDAQGTAVHKIYVENPEGEAAFDALVERFSAEDQSPLLTVAPRAELPADRPDGEAVQEELRTAWRAMTDTHEFFGIVRDLKLNREQALRLAGEELAQPVAQDALPQLLETVSQSGLPIMCFVSSPGVVQIHSGAVHTIKAMGPWINVLDADFNLHLRQDKVARAWVVRKPTSDGTVTSLELFAEDGQFIAQFFGVRKPGQPEDLNWRETVEALAQGGSAQ